MSFIYFYVRLPPQRKFKISAWQKNVICIIDKRTSSYMYQVHAQQFLKSKDLSCDLNFECTFHFFLKGSFYQFQLLFWNNHTCVINRKQVTFLTFWKVKFRLKITYLLKTWIGDDNSNIFFNKFAFKWISLKKKLTKDSCGYARSS